MFLQIRNLLKALSRPLTHSQTFGHITGDLGLNCGRSLSSHSQAHFQQCFLPSIGTVLKSSFMSPAPVTVQSIRTKVRVYYKPSAWKRYNKHNIERRLTTPGGLKMLWRRVLKGRYQLAVYERILPNTVNGKILPEEHFKYREHPLIKRKLPKPGLF